MAGKLGTLYVMGTPIGNLDDMTARTRGVLASVAACYAEDTRRTGRLTAALELDLELRSLHRHNEAERTAEIIARLRAGEDLALTTDAGTPGVSDPGARVVETALAADVPVSPIPGPSAVAVALSVSGLDADRFLFLGFAPRRGKAREAWLERALGSPDTVVAFESPRRLGPLLAAIVAAGGGERTIVVCRELTKLHEEIVRGSVDELSERFSEVQRGECTVVLAGRSDTPEPDRAAARRAAHALEAEGATTRSIAEHLREAYGLARNEAYEMALGRESDS